jgi:hypothetical protein
MPARAAGALPALGRGAAPVGGGVMWASGRSLRPSVGTLMQAPAKLPAVVRSVSCPRNPSRPSSGCSSGRIRVVPSPHARRRSGVPSMQLGILARRLLCPSCGFHDETAAISRSEIEIDEIAAEGIRWKVSGKAGYCPQCGSALHALQRYVPVEIKELACGICRSSEHLKYHVKRLRRVSVQDWIFELVVSCTNAKCRFRLIVSDFINVFNISKFTISKDGSISLERSDLPEE